MRWDEKWVPHIIVFLAIFVPKIIKIGKNLMTLWDDKSCCNTLYINYEKHYVQKNKKIVHLAIEYKALI